MRAVLSSPEVGAMIQVISQLLLRGQNLTQAIEQPRITVRPGLDQVFVEGEAYYNTYCLGVGVQGSFDFFLFFRKRQYKLGILEFQQVIPPPPLFKKKKCGRKIISTSTFLPVSSRFRRLGHHRPPAGNRKKRPSNNEPHTPDPTPPVL